MTMKQVLQPLILVAEDEQHQADMLIYNLKAAGYQTMHAVDGEEAHLLANKCKPDLVVLDWMLPKCTGIEVCSILRNNDDTKDIPIIMLTARGTEADRVRGLDFGADDFVVKPYLPSELLARIRAVLRRSRPATSEKIIECGNLRLNLETHEVFYEGANIHLSATEFRLLAVLAESPGKVFNRERLLDMAWGRDIYIESRTVDVHIRRLRKNLTDNDRKDPIRTVRGSGYALTV
jgi:two-component system, OmpR family, phosphate regulon response regulator PhoB